MKKLVVLTGAGISAESGLKTFRDGDGLWEGHDVTKVATPQAWAADAQLVLDFYNSRRKDVMATEPNQAHKILADMQCCFDVQIITQNIDDLHERAGSKNVLHLHGEIFKKRGSRDLHTWFDVREDMLLHDIAPDGTVFRPAIVWFGEAVPLIETAIEITKQADIFVVVGTSLAVYPAASLLDYVSPQASLFLVDRKVPASVNRQAIAVIEQPATLGMKTLQEKLLGDSKI